MAEQAHLSMDIVIKMTEELKKGLFLTTSGEKDNTMIIGWGSWGTMWGQSVFMVPVRQSRFTHSQLALGTAFTLSMPGDGMGEAIRICGTESGRDTDKFAAAKLQLGKARHVEVPIIQGCKAHMECRVLSVSQMDPSALDTDLRKRWYDAAHGAENQDNYHSLYFAAILAAYAHSWRTTFF